MPRYIDADKYKKDLIHLGFLPALVVNLLDKQPTADVVPRSEVERLQAQNETLDILVKDLRYRNKEYIAFNRRWAKECADLQEECDQIKDKVAREIFEEIEKCFFEELVGCTEAKVLDEEMFADLKKNRIGEGE